MRLSREDWLKLGLRRLAVGGPVELSIDRLCVQAGRTKGSFYHHFKDHDAFVNALLEYWRELFTEQVIDGLREIDDPAARRKALSSMASDLDFSIERAVRAWSMVDERAARVQRRVDSRRLVYLRDLFLDLGVKDHELAMDYAVVDFAVFLGYEQLAPILDEGRTERISKLMAGLIPETA